MVNKKTFKFRGVLIIVFLLIIGSRVLPNLLSLTPNASNSNNAAATPSSENKAVIKDGVQTLKLTASASGYTPSTLYVKKGVPVKWEINGEQLTSCNNTLVIPSLNKKFKLSKGENVFEFTPGDKDLKFSCWMGMINGTIKVVDDLDTLASSN